MLMKKSVNGVPPPSVVLASPGAERSEAERSDAERSVAPGEAKTMPDPEVVVRAKRRQYSAEYKKRILAEADSAKPDLQLFHDRPAMLLMEVEALLGRQALCPRLIVVPVDLAQSFQYEPALIGKTRRHLREVPPTVRQTVGYQCGEHAGRLWRTPR